MDATSRSAKGLKRKLDGLAPAGHGFFEPIAKFQRGHNPHSDLSFRCIGVCLTAPGREHVTNSIARPW